MTAAPKPPKRETGRSKGARSNTPSKHWKSRERDVARFFVTHTGVDPDPPVPPSSTGRVGHIVRFDTTSARVMAEVKERHLPGWIFDAWVQILQLAHERGNRHPALVLASHSDGQVHMLLGGKKVRVPEMHAITPERHAELLSYESMYRGEAPITKESIFDVIEIIEDTAA